MLAFAVFDDHGPHPAYPLRQAHIVGKDDVVIPGIVELREDVPGTIACRKSRDEAACLALQVDLTTTKVKPTPAIADLCQSLPSGKIILQTCLLPDRAEPYLLELELARHRIMLLLNKLEEWSLSDLPAEHPVMRLLDEARERFTAALVAHPPGTAGYTAEQSRLARESLVLAMEAGERLARIAGERTLLKRLSPEDEPEEDDVEPTPVPTPAARAPRIGCAVHIEQFSEPLQKAATAFDFLTVPMRWKEIEKDEGVYSFTSTDRWIEWAVRFGKKPVVGGPILDFSPRSAPGWLHVWEHDYDTLREFAFEHVKRVVTRYRRTVARWTAISGVNVNDGFSLTMDQMVDLTRIAVLATRKLQPNARVVVEISEPWGESGTENSRTLNPLLYSRLIIEAGIGVDALGLRIQMGDAALGRASRDIMQLSSLIDTYSQLERPLHITAIGAPASPVDSASAEQDPGWWGAPWSPEQQADWAMSALCVLLGKPRVRSICWQSLFDAVEMPNGGLVTPDFRARPAYKRLSDAMALLRNAQTPPEFVARDQAGIPAAAAR